MLRYNNYQRPKVHTVPREMHTWNNVHWSYTVACLSWRLGVRHRCRLEVGCCVCGAVSSSHLVMCFNIFRFLLQHIFQAFIAAGKKQHVGSVDCRPSSVLGERLQVMTDILCAVLAYTCYWERIMPSNLSAPTASHSMLR
jgi:hypothetical protein